MAPDSEVKPKRARRKFSAAEKLRIVKEAERCTKHGELGALLRREGIYSSQLAEWKLARTKGELGALGKKRGRKPTRSPEADKLAALEKDNRMLQKKLDHAEMIIDFQKNLRRCLGKRSEPCPTRRNRDGGQGIVREVVAVGSMPGHRDAAGHVLSPTTARSAAP
jgi:transposase-like protein